MSRTAGRGGAGALDTLERVRSEFGGDAETRKLAALEVLAVARLRSAREVERLHEAVCFLRAYPDSPSLLARVEEMLAAFARRRDLRRHAEALADSGIAGTRIRFAFFAPTAFWLARRFGDRLSVRWTELETSEDLERWLPLLALYSETPGLDEYAFSVREWVRRLKGPRESDAEFLARRFEALAISSFARETLYDGLDIPMSLEPGPGTPSRTLARAPGGTVRYQTLPLARGRPDLTAEARRPPRSVRALSSAEGRVLVDLSRDAMVARQRDLDAFAYADPRDVRIADCGDGLEFVVLGVVPERRLMLESVYAFLTLKNRVPVGYVLVSALYGSSEIAYNVFETWRGAEAAPVYGRALATTRAVLGSDAFTIFPYQLGQGNDEGLKSGAWWFYRKLGFEPRDSKAVRLARAEMAKLRANPAHRTGLATLRRLAGHNLYFTLGRARRDVIGEIDLPAVGLHITRFLAQRFGADRERAARVCAEEAARMLGSPPWRRWSAGERRAWERWSPLVLILPGVERWSAAERRALAGVVRAKGGPRESDFVARFDAHRRLREAVRKLAASPPP